ncbi:hypothetical protein B0J13DRAFT_526826 [Dactylonectria estremocensis]|uniref:Uncharacterized protein n=1 Tax=Dactylonectria estremocensis TaxID=1079267 RepID=A0A9P9J4C3_9HYPO|nr:hypothetical protein B0J13DRAFT_526826 [Dactylonectria estremocensis]
MQNSLSKCTMARSRWKDRWLCGSSPCPWIARFMPTRRRPGSLIVLLADVIVTVMGLEPPVSVLRRLDEGNEGAASHSQSLGDSSDPRVLGPELVLQRHEYRESVDETRWQAWEEALLQQPGREAPPPLSEALTHPASGFGSEGAKEDSGDDHMGGKDTAGVLNVPRLVIGVDLGTTLTNEYNHYMGTNMAPSPRAEMRLFDGDGWVLTLRGKSPQTIM